jgi:hypothetical protein
MGPDDAVQWAKVIASHDRSLPPSLLEHQNQVGHDELVLRPAYFGFDVDQD